jgi:hypothetical protein
MQKACFRIKNFLKKGGILRDENDVIKKREKVLEKH